MKKQHVSWSGTDRTYLKNLLRKGSLPAEVFKGAMALLELDCGKSQTEVAQTLGVCNSRVSHWCKRPTGKKD